MNIKKRLGFWLIVIGTVLASLFSAWVPPQRGPYKPSELFEKWDYVLASMLILICGIILRRQGMKERAIKAQKQEEEKLEALVYLKEIKKGILDLSQGMEEMSLPEIHKNLDKIVTGPLFKFVELRHTIEDIYGIGSYGEVMSAFALGERCLNRSWSASTDGHASETKTYIKEAIPKFEEAVQILEKIQKEKE